MMLHALHSGTHPKAGRGADLPCTTSDWMMSQPTHSVPSTKNKQLRRLSRTPELLDTGPGSAWRGTCI